MLTIDPDVRPSIDDVVDVISHLNDAVYDAAHPTAKHPSGRQVKKK
jgi:hypothetical protein